MSSAIVKYNQQLIDITMQELGDAEQVFDLSVSLGKSITAILDPGELIPVIQEPFNAIGKKFSRILKKPMNIPASGDAEIGEKLEGLEIWVLEADFIITE